MGTSEATDLDLVRGARTGCGTNTVLIDAGCVWDARTALRRAHQFLEFDIGWLDLADGLTRGALARDRLGWQQQVEQIWSPAGEALACLSVRSGWDLLLAAAGFPAGSEVLMSAVTIPDMAEIVRHHDLVPVPVDVEPATMLPTPEAISAAPFVVRVKLDDAGIAGRLPAGSTGLAAIYTDRVNASHVIRKVVLRQTAILNYVNPF